MRPNRNHPQLVEALSAFCEALGSLLDLSDRNDEWLSASSFSPCQGKEAEWSQQRGLVDRLAPPAARAMIEAGIVVQWKPPGTFQTFPVNPFAEWATILDHYPKFGVDVLFACCNQAIGSLQTGAYVPPRRRKQDALSPGSHPHLTTLLVTVIATLVAGIVVAFLAFKFGWVG